MHICIYIFSVSLANVGPGSSVPSESKPLFETMLTTSYDAIRLNRATISFQDMNANEFLNYTLYEYT